LNTWQLHRSKALYLSPKNPASSRIFISTT
jgi:hypothetical protein